MHQSLVNRGVIALSGLLLLACAGFAWVVEHPPREAPLPADANNAQPKAGQRAAPDGARLFALRCARCHEPAEAAELLVPGIRADALRAILRDHDHAPAEEDDALIAFLVTQPPAAPAPADDARR